MNMKKLVLFILILISLCAISNVSAIDNSTIISSDNSIDTEMQTIDETITETYLTNSPDDADNLKAGESTYRNIQREIDNAKDGDTINLTGEYTCDYLINVNKTINIVGTGDGAVIKYDGSSDYNSPFFNIDKNASNVVLSNIKFVGGAFSWGGAITWQGANGTIKNCGFKDNTVTGDKGLGGALLILGENCNINNCTFENNHAFKHGGAIFVNSNGCNIINCEFNDNIANGEKSHGGALTLFEADNCIVDNCIFNNNHCNDYGGAISVLEQRNTLIRNCGFYNNYVTSGIGEKEEYKGGGAIFSGSRNTIMDNCTFIENHAPKSYGGAISLSDFDTVKNSFFKGNYALSGNDLKYLCQNIISNHFVLDYNETFEQAINGTLDDYQIYYNYLVYLDNIFERTKLNSSVIFTPGLIFEYGSSGSISVTVNGGTIDPENITVLNHKEAKLSYSKNTITISNLAVGNYVLRVTTTPDENHTAVDGDMNFTVKKADAIISASKLTVALKSSAVWSIQIINPRTKNPIANMDLTLKIYTGSKYTTAHVRTNSKGVASYKTNNLAAGTHKIVVTGTHGGYKFNTLTSSITVIKQTPLKYKLHVRKNDKGGSLLSYLVSNKNTNKGMNGVKIKVLIYTGKKYKTYTLKSKKIKDKKKTYNGAIGFSTNDFSVGKHVVKIMPVDLKYKGSVTTYIKITKAATKGIKFFRKI
jgi:predicted outer membrane repeat protein